MSPIIPFVSFFKRKRVNVGCYGNPFSGVGTEFFPLGILPDHSGLILHETGYNEKNDSWNFPNTLSPFWRLYYNARKGHKVVFKNATYPLTPEYMVLIPDHQLFDSVGSNPVPHLWVTFSSARRVDIRQKIPIILTPERYELDIITKITELYDRNAECADRKRVFNLSLALLNIVLCRPEIRWQTQNSPKIEKASRFIDENFAAEISINDTARRAGMSHAAFIKAFKSHQGVTPVRFLMQIRVRQAADMLTNSDLSIENIAEKSGFSNRAYLSRVFKKITDMSPAQFRKTHAPG